MAGINPELRRAINRIKKHSLVDNIELDYHQIRITFTTGIREQWVMRSPKHRSPYAIQLPKSGYFKREIKILDEFESRPFGPDWSKHFIILRRHVKRAGFCDIRLAVHELIDLLMKEGWIQPKYPDEILFEDFIKLRDADLGQSHFGERHFWTQDAFSYPSSGRTIIEQFLPVASDRSKWGTCLEEMWSNPRFLWRTIQALLRYGRDITRRMLIRVANGISGQYCTGPNIPNLNVYRSWMNIFGNPTSIADLRPAWGAKMMAAHILRIPYGFEPDNIYSAEVGRKFGAFLKSDIHLLRDKQYDMVFLNDVIPYNYEESMRALERRQTGKVAVLLIDHYYYEQVSKSHKPDHVYFVKTKPQMMKQPWHKLVVFRS